MDDAILIPDCSCGAGKMTVNCASSKAANPLRYYYKCPSDKNHNRSFIWCDEYHGSHRPEEVPKFLASQTWSPSSVGASSQTESYSPPAEHNEPKDHTKVKPNQCAPTEELQAGFNEFRGSSSVLFWFFTCVAIVFMCFVLVLLGVILGRLI